MLDTICGRHFDGINATNIENLERSLRNRQNGSFDHAAEMSELKCRLRHLYEAKYGTAPEDVVEQELQHKQPKHPKQMENEVPSGGAIDRYGNFYPRSGNGVINPQTGEYYPRTGNGYFNPRTGEFMPAM